MFNKQINIRYVRNAGPSPPRVYPAAPSGPPVPTREDIHYPHEERDERAHNPVPALSGIGLLSNGTCVLTTASRVGVVASLTGEEVLNGNTFVVPGTVPVSNSTTAWFAYACVDDTSAHGRGVMAVLGQSFARWSRLVYVNTSAVVVDLRLSVGAAVNLSQPRYNFTRAEPRYFDRAQREYGDYLGRRIRNGSSFGEAVFSEAIRYSAPAQEYALIGTNAAVVKWVVCPDGVVKRSDKALLEPNLDASAASCQFAQRNLTGWYIPGYPNGTRRAYATLSDAQHACCNLGDTCGGVTTEPRSTDGMYTLRAAGQAMVGAPTDVTWVCTWIPSTLLKKTFFLQICLL